MGAPVALKHTQNTRPRQAVSKPPPKKAPSPGPHLGDRWGEITRGWHLQNHGAGLLLKEGCETTSNHKHPFFRSFICSQFWESLFVILAECSQVLSVQIQEEIHHSAVLGTRWKRGTKIVNKHVVNKLTFPKQGHREKYMIQAGESQMPWPTNVQMSLRGAPGEKTSMRARNGTLNKLQNREGQTASRAPKTKKQTERQQEQKNNKCHCCILEERKTERDKQHKRR